MNLFSVNYFLKKFHEIFIMLLKMLSIAMTNDEFDKIVVRLNRAKEILAYLLFLQFLRARAGSFTYYKRAFQQGKPSAHGDAFIHQVCQGLDG